MSGGGTVTGRENVREEKLESASGRHPAETAPSGCLGDAGLSAEIWLLAKSSAASILQRDGSGPQGLEPRPTPADLG